MADIEIYSAALCPFAHRSRLTLLEKGVQFELTEIDLQNKPANFSDISPTGQGPVLKHGDRRVWESAIINEYLEETLPEFTMKTEHFEDVLRFWFPEGFDQDQTTLVRQWQRWFRGGMDTDIIEHFSPLLERAKRGELDAWAREPRSRLALIIVLDQFSRTLYRDTALAFAQDPKACALTLEGISTGHYEALQTPAEKTFFFLPLGHSEDLHNLELAIKFADELVQEASQEDFALLKFSAEQARCNRDVIARFGRHPHRNQVLGRQSTPEEREYLATGQLVHTRSFPPNLQQLL